MPDVPTMMSWTLNVMVVTSNHGQDKCNYPGMTIYVNDTKKPDVFIACPRKDSVGDCVFHCSGYTPGQWDGPRLFVRLEIPITGHWHMPETVCEIITEWEPEVRNYVSDSWTSIDQNTVTMIYGVQLIWLKKPILTLHDLWTSHFVHRLNKVHSEFRVLLFHLCHNYMMTSSNGNTFSVLLPLCVRNSPVTGEFPAQRPVTRSFDVFFDMSQNKRLSKQSLGWWFETPSRSLWRHCDDKHIFVTHCGPVIPYGDIDLCHHWCR